MDKAEKNESKEIKEIKKEEIVADIKRALALQERAAQPAPPVQPKDVEQPVKAEEPNPSEQAEHPSKAEEPNPSVQTEKSENIEPPMQVEEPKSEKAEKPAQAKPPKLPKLSKIPTLKDLKGRLRRLSKRNGLLLVLVELILVLFLAVILTQHISLNSNDPTSDSGFIDEINCADGQLSVNTVSVSVPTEGGVSYSIAYEWGKDDKDYPTEPKVAIASYHAEGGDQKYDISLYRDSFTQARRVPAGKDASNWFSDWKEVNDGQSTQSKKKSGDIDGFLVSTVGNDPEGAYETTSFYFAVASKEGISVYVVEGLLYDRTNEKEFNKVMEDVIASVRTKKQAA